MSKDQTDTHLRYGQGIIIKGYKPEKDPNQGYLTVRGFADTRANYETISDILYFKNYRNAIFQFLPAGNFQINDELFKQRSKIVDTKGQEQDLERTIQTLQARAESQQAQFQLGIKRKKKVTIKFGDLIMLRHIDSETYLSGTIRPSDGTNGAFSVEVSNRLSKALVFQLLPYRSFEAESMQIPFSSPVLIKNVFNNGYLTFQKLGIAQDTTNLNRYMEKIPTQSDKSYQIPVKTSTKDSKVYQVVTHFVDLSIEEVIPMPWQFQLHFKQVENDSLIQHDIVYLKHTQNNGILSAIGQDIMLKESKVQGLQGLQFYQSLWQIQKFSSSDQPAKIYILRHLMSGMTLGVKRNQEGEPDLAALIDISQGQGCQIGKIELKLAKKDGGEINSESFIYLCQGDYILDVYPQEQLTFENVSNLIFSGLKTSGQLVNKEKMKKLSKNQIQYNTRRLKFTSDIPKNCFVIQQIDDDLKKQLLFALSFHSTIINLREDLKWGATDSMKKVNYIRMMKVTEKIAEITDFLKGCEPNDPQKKFKQPIYKRQMICKDLGLSQLLFELLFYMRQNMKEEIFKEKINEREKFYEMHEQIYQVIIYLIKDNKIFKTHVSKWIMFIIEDFIEKGFEIHCVALLQLLKDNQFFLQNFVTPDLIEYLLENMLKQRTSKSFTEKRYIDVFRAFCLIGEKVYSLNQALILKHFIERLSTIAGGKYYQIQFVQKGNQISCKVALDKRNIQQYQFQTFKELCKQQDMNGHIKYPQSWQYFSAYLNLLADITKGRNKSIQKYVSKQLPLQLLTQLFDHYDTAELQVPIIKIIHYLYAENENFYPIDKENRIVAYDSIETSQINVRHFSGPLSPWSFMEKVLNKLKIKLSQAGPILPKDPVRPQDGYDKHYFQNQVLIQLLLLVQQTLNLGFWMVKQDIEQIYTHVLRILQKHPQIDYEQSQKMNKQNELMIACKIECLKIVDLIINQDMSISLQVCNKVFRDFQMQPPQQFPQNTEFLLQAEGELPFAKQFAEKIEQRSKQYQPMVGTKIYDQMIELSNYNNPILTGKSLQILSRVLDNRKHRINKFYNEIFVCEPDCVILAQFLTNLKNKFFILEDINTPKITYENQNQNYFNVYTEENGAYKQSSNTGIMQDMYMITELMKNQNQISNIERIQTLDSSGIFNRLGSQNLINFTDERKSSNLTKQKIVDAANIHLKILAYMVNCQQVPQSELALKLLHLCYYVIVSLIENHQEMKPKIIPYLPKLMRHFRKNVGCIDLLKQMYDNNKNMLYNESEIYLLIRQICDQVNQQTNILYKAKLLDFFRFLIYLNNKCLRNNQIFILKIIQDDDYTNILQHVNVDIVKKYVANYNIINKEDTFPEDIVKCEPDLVYLSTYFQILNSLIDQSNSVNIGKLIKRFPFQLLTECISASENCWMLKRNIRAVINRMYYFEVGTNVYLSLIIKNQIINIIDDFDRFLVIKNKTEEQVNRLANIRFENPVRFTYLQSYLYLNLQENLFTLFSMFNSAELYEELLNLLKNLHEANDFSNNLIRIAERLAELRRYFTKHQNIHTMRIVKFLQLRLHKMLQCIKIQVYQPGFSRSMKNYARGNADEEEKAKNLMIQKIFNGEIGEFYQDGSEKYRSKTPLVYLLKEKPSQIRIKHEKDDQKLLKKLRQIFSRKKLPFANRDEQANQKMLKIVKALKVSKIVNRQLITSFENSLIQCYQNSADGSDNLLNFISVIIQINTNNPDILPEQLKIFILKIINCLFYQANKSQPKSDPEENNKPRQTFKIEEEGSKMKFQEQSPKEEEQEFKQIDQWEAEDWEQNQQKINSLQQSLMNCEIGSFISSLFKGANLFNNVTLANSILLCSISFMLGGNPSTQKNIKEELSKDTENKILVNIKKLINNLGSLILKNIHDEQRTAERDQYVNQFHIDYVDNYDFFDVDQKHATRKNVSQPHYVDQILHYKECIVTYRRAFKFLQLLCQNNNIQNKNFIRQQPHSSQPIDFIQIATKQLRNIFQVLNQEIAEVPIFILDFILEVTQIPVKQNQDALIKSSFFEDVCQLANMIQKQGQKARGFEKDRSALDEIFQKCVQIILSNFEGNSENYFNMLDDKLDPNFLIKLLRQKLTALGIHTKQDFEAYQQKVVSPQMVDGKLSSETIFDENISGILQIIVIFIKVKNKVGTGSKIYSAYEKQKVLKDKNDQKVNQQLFEMLQNCLLKIEINDFNNTKQEIYFPNHPVFGSISGGLKDYIMSNVKRDTHRQKIISLLGYVDGVRQKINEAYNFQKCQNMSQDVMNGYYSFSSKLSIVICIYMLLFYNVYIEYGQAQFTGSWPAVIIRFILSLIQLKYSLLYGYSWYKLKVWVKPEPKSRQGKKNTQIAVQILNHAGSLASNLQEEEKKTGFLQKYYRMFNQKLETACEKFPKVKTVVEQLKQFKESIVPSQQGQPKLQDSGQFIKILLYITVSIVGTFYYPPAFFIHIIDLICSIKQLGNIFQAIGLVIVPLFYVSFMGVVFVIVFSSVTFSNYMKDVYGDTKDENQMCSNPIGCILALYVSGAIGQTMSKFQIVRFVYDMIYIIFFGLLFGNIISGLMLDAFGSLGEQMENLQSDKKNYCYICNISRQRIEKNGQKFQQHIQNHHLWNYIFYIIALEKKSPTDYTGLEYYISQKYNLPDQQMDVTWIPDGEEVSFQKQAFVSEMLLQLNESQQSTNAEVKGLEEKIDEFVKHSEAFHEG